MKASYYQVVGSGGPVTIDYPTGDAKNHRTGQIFEARASNPSVIRALRMNRLREMSDRETSALKAAKAVAVAQKAPPAKPMETEAAPKRDSKK